MRLKYLIIIVIMHVVLNSCAQTKKNKPMEETKKFDITKSDAEWRNTLTETQYYILREKGTERPYTGKFLMHKENGKYTCAACGNELFDSDAKFDSHCGWPSFDKEIAGGKVVTQVDHSAGMTRTEIMCGKCGGHLGHVFNDGPTSTGLRYCVNSESLGFQAEGNLDKSSNAEDTVTLGGGCFWCIEAVFSETKGVKSAISGYSGGKIKNPSYKEVCTGTTQHAEVVQVVYNPSELSLVDLLKVFFTVHDPTTLNRQGADIGTQYRSVIYYRNEAQRKTAEEVISALSIEKVYNNPIVTELSPFSEFYKAENYHQGYFNANGEAPYCQMVIRPKSEKFEKAFKNLIKK